MNGPLVPVFVPVGAKGSRSGRFQGASRPTLHWGRAGPSGATVSREAVRSLSIPRLQARGVSTYLQ